VDQSIESSSESVSIHASVMEATGGGASHYVAGGVSIHASVMEATRRCARPQRR